MGKIKYNEKKQNSRSSTIDHINKSIDLYLQQNPSKRRNAKKALKQVKDQELLIRALNARIMIKSGMTRARLLILGFSLMREKYIFECLNACVECEIDLDAFSFFQNIGEHPLTNEEKKQIAYHIAKCSKYDIRLLGLLSSEALDIALEGILQDVIKHGLDGKKLNALSRKRQFLTLIQERIIEDIQKDTHGRKSWIRYLDLSSEKNRLFIDLHYNLYDVFEYTESCMQQHEFPDSYNIRVSQRIRKKIKIDDADLNKLVSKIKNDMHELDNGIGGKKLISLVASLAYYDRSFAEETLIYMYRITNYYENEILDELIKLQSMYAYRELLNITLTTEDITERYANAVKIVKNYPDKTPFLIEYCDELGDDRLIRRINELAQTYDVAKSKSNNQIEGIACESVQILPQSVIIPELIFHLASSIDAIVFYAAVGFVFSSGLKLLLPAINCIQSNSGCIEIISGSLQRYKSAEQNAKIDRKTVRMLNTLIQSRKVTLYTDENKFYHGKFYYIANTDVAYVIIGSSNISKTAYIGNVETDILITIPLKHNESDQYRQWYEDYKEKCSKISYLNEENFFDMNWNSELDAFAERFLKKMSIETVYERLKIVDEDERRRRIELWLKRNPVDIFCDFGVEALKDYFLLLFPDYSLAVFDSFYSGNAYYVFNYIDIEELLSKISKLSKTGMQQKSDLINRGYHIANLERLEEKISKYFVRPIEG